MTNLSNIKINHLDKSLLPTEKIANKIILLRDEKVMIDFHLAELYEIETKQLKRQVRRNIERFPEDFMFELNKEEFENLRSQLGTSSWGGSRYMPIVFTEQGVAMLSSVLNSETAINVNIQIIRVFTKMRNLLSSHQEILKKIDELERKDIQQDDNIMLIFEYLKQFEEIKQQELEQKNRKTIGYKN